MRQIKFILAFLAVLITATSYSQSYTVLPGYGSKADRITAVQALQLPRIIDTTVAPPTTISNRVGHIGYWISAGDTTMMMWTGKNWKRIVGSGGGSGGGVSPGLMDSINTVYNWYSKYNDTTIVCGYWIKAGAPIATLPFDTSSIVTPGTYYFRQTALPQLAVYSYNGTSWTFAQGFNFDKYPYGAGYPLDTVNYGGTADGLGKTYFDTLSNDYYSLSPTEICDTILPAPLSYEFEGAMYMYKNIVRFGDHYIESGYTHDLADFDFDTRWYRKDTYSKLGMTVASETNNGVSLIVDDLAGNNLGQIGLKDVRYATVTSARPIQAIFSNGAQRLFFGTNGAGSGFERISMMVSDGANQKGLENEDDYSANFTSNSLITKIYASRLSDTTIFITSDSISKYGVSWTLDNNVTSYRVYNLNIDRSGYDANGGNFGIRCLTPFTPSDKVNTYNIVMVDTSHKPFYVSFNQTNGVDDMSINGRSPLYIFSQPYENATFRAQSQISKNMVMSPANREVSIIRPLPSAAPGTTFAFTDNKNYLPYTYAPTTTDFNILGTAYEVEIIPLDSDGLSVKSAPYFVSDKTTTGNFTLNYSVPATVTSGGMIKIVYRFKYAPY